MSVKLQAINSLKWSFLAEMASKLITPVVFIVLAKILAPEDFGVIAAASIVISFSQIFWDAGFSKALIQRQDGVEEAAQVVFWVNCFLGILIYILLFLSSTFLAGLFHDIRISNVLKILGLQVVFASISSVHTALFQKGFHFKKLFWVRLLTVALPGMASVPCAMMGFGYWALVAGTLTGQFFQVIILWFQSPWRPKMQFDLNTLKSLWKFGSWVMLGGVLTWFYLWMDSIMVGMFLSPRELGLYRTGNSFSAMIYGLFFIPLMPVLYSTFSKISNDLERVKEKLLVVVKAISMISFPIAAGLFVLRDYCQELFFGPDWIGVGGVIGVLALSQGVSWIVGANGEMYRAIGRPDIETKIMIIAGGIFLCVYLVSVQYGLRVFVFSRAAVIVFGLCVHIYFAKVVAKVPIGVWPRISLSATIAAVSMGIAMHIFVMLVPISPVYLLFSLALGGIVYSLVLAILEKGFIVQVLKPIFYTR